MKGSRALVEMLKVFEVEVIFGMPGDTSIPLYEALCDAQSSIRHIKSRNEHHLFWPNQSNLHKEDSHEVDTD